MFTYVLFLIRGYFLKLYITNFHFLLQCGRPYVVAKCKVCGLEIGGEGHVLRPGNVKDEEG